MNLRTLTQLQEVLSQELIWREKELIELNALINDKHSSRSKRDVLVRAGIALLYAHWEGFIKTAGAAYLEFIAKQGLKNSDLALNFLALAAKAKLNTATGANSIAIHLEVTRFYLEQREEPCSLPYETAIQTSNLNYKLFQEITLVLGLDLSVNATKANLIDLRLVKNRNTIAHGEYLLVDLEEYNELHREIIGLLNLFHNEILNQALQKKYLRGT